MYAGNDFLIFLEHLFGYGEHVEVPFAVAEDEFLLQHFYCGEVCLVDD